MRAARCAAVSSSDELRGRVERGTRAASRLRTVLIAVGILTLNFAGVAALFLYDDGFDPYDDAVRGTNPMGSVGVDFGQAIGPDGDGCWPENSRDYSGTVYCDLVSIGGLHWDTGDVKVVAGSPFSIEMAMGSGFMCMIDEDRAPWCWEWSSETQPRPARVPQDAQFDSIRAGGGFVCGQTTDFVTVVCWTIGADRAEYRQANHRADDGSKWNIYGVSDDPPTFTGDPRGFGPGGRFHAFTGRKPNGDPSIPGPWVTETVP